MKPKKEDEEKVAEELESGNELTKAIEEVFAEDIGKRGFGCPICGYHHPPDGGCV